MTAGPVQRALTPPLTFFPTDSTESNADSKAGFTSLAVGALTEAYGKYQNRASGVLRLERVKPVPVKTEKLNLSKEDKALIDIIFSKWALSNDLCLLELWALDLYEHLQLLHLPKISQKVFYCFQAYFLMGYAGILSCSAKSIPSISCFFSDKLKFLVTSKEWSDQLLQLEKEIGNLYKGGNLRIKEFKDSQIVWRDVKSRLRLGRNLLAQTNTYYFLAENNIERLSKYFPKGQFLNKGNAKKTLIDLIKFNKFLADCCETGVKARVWTVGTSFFSKMDANLKALPKKRAKLPLAVSKLKQVINGELREIGNARDHINGCLPLIMRKEMSREEYFASTGSKITYEKTHTEFVASTILQLLQTTLIATFIENIVDILDFDVMHVSFPESYVPTKLFHMRFVSNLYYLIQQSKTTLPKENVVAKPSSGTLTEASSSIETLAKTETPVQTINCPFSALEKHGLFLDAVNRIDSDLLDLFQDLIKDFSNMEKCLPKIIVTGSHAFDGWDSFIETELSLHIKQLEGVISRLNELGFEHSRIIFNYLKVVDPAIREELFSMFQQICFDSAIFLCRYIMTLQDAEMLLKSESHTNFEDHLLPSVFIDYIRMERVNGLLSKFERGNSPVNGTPKLLENDKPSDIPPPIKPENKDDEKAGSKPAPAISPPKISSVDSKAASVEPAPLKFRRGMSSLDCLKAIVEALTERNIIPTVETSKGSHWQVRGRDEEGKDVGLATIPGNKPSIPLGTLGSIQKQVSSMFDRGDGKS